MLMRNESPIYLMTLPFASLNTVKYITHYSESQQFVGYSMEVNNLYMSSVVYSVYLLLGCSVVWCKKKSHRIYSKEVVMSVYSEFLEGIKNLRIANSHGLYHLVPANVKGSRH